MMIKEDKELPRKIDRLFIDNPLMVTKAKDNSKLEGWFVGQLMKENKNLDPKIVSQTISERIKFDNILEI